MLVSVTAIFSLLIRRGMIINEERREEAVRLAEELRQQEEGAIFVIYLLHNVIPKYCRA